MSDKVQVKKEPTEVETLKLERDALKSELKAAKERCGKLETALKEVAHAELFVEHIDHNFQGAINIAKQALR